jgi:hypothetical protein
MRFANLFRLAGCVTSIGIGLSATRVLLAVEGVAGDGQAPTSETTDPAPPKETATTKGTKRPESRTRPQGRVVIPIYRLGAALAPVDPALKDPRNLKGEGLLVQRVAPGGPADKAGI